MSENGRATFHCFGNPRFCEPLPKERCVHTKNGQDIAVILCTSGTTGGTKGVLLTHDNVRYSEDTFNRELGLTEEDIMFMPAPLHHATGFHHAIIAPMLHGAKVYCSRNTNADRQSSL